MATCTGPRTVATPHVLGSSRLPRHCTAPDSPFFHVRNDSPYDCTAHSLQRSLSWYSLQESLNELEKPTMGAFEPKPSIERRPAPPLVIPGSTLDMAYFLRNTGPPSSRNLQQLEEKKANIKPLGLFKRRKHSTSGLLSKESSQSSFTPPEGVIQKVSKDGKKYLQIVANSSTFSGSDISRFTRSQRLSVTFSDRTDIIGTEALDSWISTFSPGHHELPHSKPPSYEVARDGKESSVSPKKGPNVESPPPQLPAVDSGFGLSIVNDPAFGVSPPDTVDANTALGSNPPSLSTLQDDPAVNRSTFHDELINVEDAIDAIIEQKSKQSMTEQQLNAPTTPPPTKESSLDGHPSQSTHRPAHDIVRYQFTPTPSRSRDTQQASQYSTLEQSGSSMRHDDASAELLPETRSNATQLARLRREQKIRARKLREVQHAREKLEDESGADVADVKPPTHYGSVDQSDDNPKVSRFSRLSVSSECQTPKDPPPPPTEGTIVAPIAVIPEQAVPTLPKPHSSKKPKPARLNLHKTAQVSPTSTFAAHSESPTISPSIHTGITQISASPQTEPAQESSASSAQPSPDDTSPTAIISSKHHASLPMRRAKSARQPPRQPPRQPHVSGPSILNTAFPAPPSSLLFHQRASIASKDTCTSTSLSTAVSKDASRLESRIESLERENRLLEAALMAVLRTSGTLNRCPCYFLSKTREGQAGRLRLDGTRDGDEVGERGRARERTDRRTVTGDVEKRESCRSDFSDGSGVNALEVYLGTRMGEKVRSGVSS